MMNLLAAVNTNQWLVLAGVLVVGAITYREQLARFVPSFRKTATDTLFDPSVVPSQRNDVEDMAALRRIQRRASESGCDEFVAAVDKCKRCFFEDPDPTTLIKPKV